MVHLKNNIVVFLTLISILFSFNSNSLNLELQPVGFIGHGAMFDASGKKIDVTAAFIESAQQYYIEALQVSLSKEHQIELELKKKALAKNESWDKQSSLYVSSILLDWLVDRVDLKDAGDLKGKNALFKSFIKHRLFEKTLLVPKVVELFSDESSNAVLFSTVASGAAYITECENAGVPKPPKWDKDDADWVKSGASTLSPNFLGGNANVYYFEQDSSPGPEGVCIALPRDSGGDIYALGIICQGKQTGNVCYWDNQASDSPFPVGQNEDLELLEFAGGAELKDGGGGICTACHAGENTYVIHPASDLASVPKTMPDVWYTPLVHPDWPQNAGPYTGLSENTQCTNCHKQGDAGRFPKISSAINIYSVGGGSYCNAVLNVAIGNTMPPGGNTAGYEGHIGILQGLCDITPTPVMRIENVVLDYNQVELGFSFTKALVIHNDGDANLTFSITAPSVAEDNDVAQWDSVPVTTDVTIAPGDSPQVFRYIYQPDEIAEHTFQIQLTSNDGNQAITLTGEGTAPVPIDTVLVLDRSGSMQDSVGERKKIDAMRDAANLYADLLRDEVGASGTGDKLGLVKYNDTNSIYEVFTEMDAPKRSTINDTRLSNAALTDIGRLKPDDATGIGGAMQTAAFQFGGAADDRKQVMVVLTDGIENREPYIADVVDPIRATFPDLKMYSIGLGENIEPTKLQNITNVSDGYHQVTAVLSDTTLFDLETFYFKIFVNAADMDLVVDPTYVVNLNTLESVVIDKAKIISSDKRATFLIMDDPYLRPYYDIEFVSPKGEIITPGSSVGGIPVQESSRHTYKIYRVVFPDIALKDEYVGDWIVRLKPNGKWNKTKKTFWKDYLNDSPIQYSSYLNPIGGFAPVGFATAVASDYKLDVKLHPTHYLPGAEVLLTASLSDRGWPTTDGTINVMATSQSGINQSLTLFDDGSHGDQQANDGTWSNRFLQTADPSVYKFFFQSLGKNERGELAPREDTRYLTLMKPEKTPRPKPCIPCNILYGLLVVLILIILILIGYRITIRTRG